jgi:hypothetical protein
VLAVVGIERRLYCKQEEAKKVVLTCNVLVLRNTPLVPRWSLLKLLYIFLNTGFEDPLTLMVLY